LLLAVLVLGGVLLLEYRQRTTEYAQLHNRLVAMQERLDRLEQQRGAPTGDAVAAIPWHELNLHAALTEVELLLVMAAHTLTLTANVPAAVEVLEAAALRLQDLPEPALYQVRAQLHEDIQRLRGLRYPRPHEWAQWLYALRDDMERWPPPRTTAPGGDTGQAGAASATKPTWWATVRAELRNLVRIRRAQESEATPVAEATQALLLRQWEAAWRSHVRQDAAGLGDALRQMHATVATRLDKRAPAVRAAITELARLHHLAAEAATPVEISSSLETLRAYLRQRTPQA